MSLAADPTDGGGDEVVLGVAGEDGDPAPLGQLRASVGGASACADRVPRVALRAGDSAPLAVCGVAVRFVVAAVGVGAAAGASPTTASVS